MTRCPFSLSRLVKVSDTGQVIYQSEKQVCRAFPDPKGDGMRASADAPAKPAHEQAASQRSSQAWAMLSERPITWTS